MNQNEHRSLDGIKVLDLSRLLPAPFCTMVLRDLGAEVDKLEDTGLGDGARPTYPLTDDGMGAMYHWLNRGKRSVVLDLKSEAGKAAFLRMIGKYDVLVESNRPGVMDRLGLGYSTLKEHNPGLVYCAITGYGQDGPLKDRAGHDLNYISRGGVLGLQGPVGGPPQTPGVQIADIGGGLFGVIGILAALQHRGRTGEGRFVDISMTEAAVSFSLFGLACHFGGLQLPAGAGMLMGAIANYRTYATKDGAVSLGALEPKFWKAFCEGAGLPFDPSVIMPGPHQADWHRKVSEIFLQKTNAEWVEFGAKHDCCLEPVLSPDEVVADPQHVARDVFMKRPTHGAGEVFMARTPVAPAAEGVAPKQGMDSARILEECGFTGEEIEALKRDGVTR
jgi:alpha-methylacyl-CoA racemase